ncbi:uncharacterized protein PGTG_15788 [Puccinia graminis f. sp. tritici CRL 75-36-700-3]|uniref:Uncharacterized protein n=1 Tax=Puccinia graminis f. sp. tritici (strain CRL 75-36-700-3 / race SCCL) TaxID=418459 RepID=E3KZV1_PUCGT|nr:uncharacterized protein PGTG_15788 [Puccinia graminis f. sp. tritici CRL 75-36-700-3]EFP89832.2 hypothetical protein PGTG_15788 [Puccinia graminis f. sp. tritici CRL 75-36-700-3]
MSGMCFWDSGRGIINRLPGLISSASSVLTHHPARTTICIALQTLEVTRLVLSAPMQDSTTLKAISRGHSDGLESQIGEGSRVGRFSPDEHGIPKDEATSSNVPGPKSKGRVEEYRQESMQPGIRKGSNEPDDELQNAQNEHDRSEYRKATKIINRFSQLRDKLNVPQPERPRNSNYHYEYFLILKQHRAWSEKIKLDRIEITHPDDVQEANKTIYKLMAEIQSTLNILPVPLPILLQKIEQFKIN